MHIYSIYTNEKERDAEPTLIKQEFSVIAGLFTGFWALYNRMWLVAFLSFAIAFFLNSADLYELIAPIKLVAFLFFGCFASQIQEYYAQKKAGLTFSDIILADDLEEAELKYYIRTNNH
jgi:signal transduction histidine kinase